MLVHMCRQRKQRLDLAQILLVFNGQCCLGLSHRELVEITTMMSVNPHRARLELLVELGDLRFRRGDVDVREIEERLDRQNARLRDSARLRLTNPA
jgi:hypothetical protein